MQPVTKQITRQGAVILPGEVITACISNATPESRQTPEAGTSRHAKAPRKKGNKKKEKKLCSNKKKKKSCDGRETEILSSRQYRETLADGSTSTFLRTAWVCVTKWGQEESCVKKYRVLISLQPVSLPPHRDSKKRNKACRPANNTLGRRAHPAQKLCVSW